MQIKLYDFFLKDGFYLTQSYFNNPAYYSQFGLLGHEGVDFGHANKTQAIRSVLGGQCFTGFSSSYGNFVIVINFTQKIAVYYCHLSTVNVISGQNIIRGTVIGNMGSTGNSTAPHCHFNFCFVDQNGTRLYKTKNQNQGFLDPMYPRDPNPPKKFEGVPDYDIVWDNLNDLEEESEPMSDQTVKNSDNYDKVCSYLKLPKNSEEVINEIKKLEADRDGWKQGQLDAEKKIVLLNEALNKASEQNASLDDFYESKIKTLEDTIEQLKKANDISVEVKSKKTLFTVIKEWLDKFTYNDKN